jgi:hypothetical protein
MKLKREIQTNQFNFSSIENNETTPQNKFLNFQTENIIQ